MTDQLATPGSDGRADTAPTPDTGDAANTVTETPDVPGTDVESPEEGDDFNVPVSLDEVPPALRPEVEKHLKNYEKQFKGAYTKKTMAIAEERRQRDAELARTQADRDALQAVAVEVLKDPSKLAAYRKLYGLDKEPEPPPEYRTVEDVLAAVDSKVEAKLTAAERKIQNDIAVEKARLEGESKWATALEAWRADPKFKKYEKVVIGMLKEEPKYQQLYQKIRNEKELIGRAFEDFKGMFREDLEAAKTAGLTAVETKKQSSTTVPGKTVPTQSARPAGLSKEEVIARVRQRLGRT